MTKLNLASVLAIQGAAKEARTAHDEDPNRAPIATVAIRLDFLDDLLADLIDFHAPLLAEKPKKGKKK